jgi:hypothetical protein
LAKHLLTLEPDFDFVLIGISSHAKDYRICWALNNTLNIELKKIESLEIKGNKKQSTPSFFSAFEFEDADNFIEYFVLANLSEGKAYTANANSLFEEEDAKESRENEFLIPEYKQMNYFFIVKGEVSDNRVDDLLTQIKELDIVLTAITIDVTSLKSKQNLIF